jgi:hypothetical protein
MSSQTFIYPLNPTDPSPEAMRSSVRLRDDGFHSAIALSDSDASEYLSMTSRIAMCRVEALHRERERGQRSKAVRARV